MPGVANGGTILASNGLLTLSGPVTGAGSLAIATGAELELGGATAETVGFGGDVGTLKLDQPGSFTGSITGLVQGDTIDLAGIQATSAVVNGSTLTVTAGAQTFTYQVAGSGLATNAFALEDDQHGGTDLVLGPPGPTISGPTSQTAFLGWPSLLGPLTIADPNAGSGLLTVTITAASGTLSGVDINGNPLNGSGSNKLVLTGDLADINTMLAGVTYNGVTAGATDDVQVAVTDANNATAAQTIAVTTDTVPFTKPIGNIPSQAFVVTDTPSALAPVDVSDPYAQSTNTPLSFTVTVPPGSGTLGAHGPSGATIAGIDTNKLTITGTVTQINNDLADYTWFDVIGLFFTTVGGLGTIAYYLTQQSAQANAALGWGAEQEAALKLLQAGEKRLIASWVANVQARCSTEGCPHFVTWDGLGYDLNAVGEFVYAKSTQSGDTFQIQVRLEPLNNSSIASVITQVAASVGSDRITIDSTRADPMWIDGTPVQIGVDQSIEMAGGQISEIAANTFQVNWDTGEFLLATINVTQDASYIDVSAGISSNDTPGTLEGLLGPDTGQANDFTLPDGTVLQQPLTTSELYTEFANAWRVTQSSSLFDYAQGQSTTTFTNLNFPGEELSLSDFPSAIVQQAQQAVTSAGITDPGAQQEAELDYIVFGGDLNVVNEDASLSQGETVTPTAPSSSGPSPVLLGIVPTESNVEVAPSGSTAVTFEVYLTEPEATNTTVDYAAVSPEASDLNAADFGGALPQGAITIAAGKTTGEVTVDVPQGALGTSASNNLAMQINSPGGLPIAAQTAQAEVYQPEAGAPPVPQLDYLGTAGTFTQSGSNYTLDLGLLQLGEPIPDLSFGIVNAADELADQLAGTLTWSTVAGYSVSFDGNTTSGVSIPSPIGAGDSEQGLDVTTETGLIFSE